MRLDSRAISDTRTIRMLGTRGVPAAHGGFETAVENVGRLLVERGWRVVIYCQLDGSGEITEDTWKGIDRVLVPVDAPGSIGTAVFDWRAARHAASHRDICIVFGYNTAMFNVLQRAMRIPLIFNMDGIEWQRDRWGIGQRAFLYANERIASRIGLDLIADHPEIERYLSNRADPTKITMIPYGADAVVSTSTAPVRQQGLVPGRYLTLICRPVPENSILEIVRGFSRKHRGVDLAVLGDYGESDDYQRTVRAAASNEVRFLGSIYDPIITKALRFHGIGYLHGHTVGGTNPSLVEALAAGNPVIAHDNRYNRWVAGDSALYFRGAADVDRHLTRLVSSRRLREDMQQAGRARHAELFTWDRITDQYEQLALKYVTTSPSRHPTKVVTDDVA